MVRNFQHRVAIGISFGGVRRELAVNRWIGVAVTLAVPVLATWYLGATLYFVFHDQLLASLIARQTDMQYSYEDRIAALKTELDRETSRGLVDRNALATTVRGLAAEGAKLEARAKAVDSIIAQTVEFAAPLDSSARSLTSTSQQRRPPAADDSAVLGQPFGAPLPRTMPAGLSNDASRNPVPDGITLKRAFDSSAISNPNESSESNGVADLFHRLDEMQSRAVARLREPVVRRVAVLRAALAETGLPPQRWGLPTGDLGVGGPFVPLPADLEPNFDTSVALLRDAIRQSATLQAIAGRLPLRHPLGGEMEVTSTFGPRLDPFYGRPAMHTGIDLIDNAGDAVVATAAGVVTIAGSEGGYGNMVEVDHGNGIATRYAHLSAIEVATHQKVHVGDVLGRIGSTGRATGPHLHYETRIDGEPVDPARFLRAGSNLFPG